jgi:hypothetical protein
MAAGTSADDTGPVLTALQVEVEMLLARAAQIDAGFERRVLADMIATLDRFTDSDIFVPDGISAAGLRAFYQTWQSELSA